MTASFSMKSVASLSLLLLSLLSSERAKGLDIIFRYDLDTSGFFEQAGAKEALEAAAGFYEKVIIDELGTIDPFNFQGGPQQNWHPTYQEPSSQNSLWLPNARNLVVPADSIVIFVGARTLDSTAQGGPGGFDPLNTTNLSWYNNLLNRGEDGALRYSGGAFSQNPSDFAPWGGTMFFNEDLTWNFSTTDATNPGIDFIPAALHEIGHVLGLGNDGSAASSWIPLVSGSTFQGPLSIESNGNTPPSLSGGIHWATSIPNSSALPAFGRKHGESQKALLQPLVGSTEANFFTVPTDLELAALQDIGWELSLVPDNFSINADHGPEGPVLQIPSTTGVNYQIYRADSPDNLTAIGDPLDGDGSVISWTDPNGTLSRAFYQVEACPDTAGPKSASKTSRADKSMAPLSAGKGFPILPASQCDCHLH